MGIKGVKMKREAVTKKDLVNRLSEKGYTKYAAGIIWDDVVEVMREALVEGHDIKFMGFGSLVIREINERPSIHPGTKERIIIPAHKTIRFLPGEILKSELANGFIRG